MKSKRIRIILIGIIVAAVTTLTYSQSLKVTVKNVKSSNGMVRLALYNSEELHMKKEIQTREVKPTNGVAEVFFENVIPGVYSISVMHDVNDNKELDTNLIGIPKEGFGFSNDAMGTFGPPDFKKASFSYPDKKEMVISLRYL